MHGGVGFHSLLKTKGRSEWLPVRLEWRQRGAGVHTVVEGCVEGGGGGGSMLRSLDHVTTTKSGGWVFRRLCAQPKAGGVEVCRV